LLYEPQQVDILVVRIVIFTPEIQKITDQSSTLCLLNAFICSAPTLMASRMSNSDYDFFPKILRAQ